MRSIRRIVAVVGVVLALGVLAPTAAATSPKEFHLTKTCESSLLCTVVSSDFEGIPPGTDVTYTVTGDGSDGLAYPTIKVGSSSTTGVCDWNQPGPVVLAKCTFGTGTGGLTQFHLDVDVTVSGDPNAPAAVWSWTGTYSLGSQDLPQTDTADRPKHPGPSEFPLLALLTGLAVAITMLVRRPARGADDRAQAA